MAGDMSISMCIIVSSRWVDVMAEKEATERRVYVLPAEQLERIRAYQTANSIASEVEAERRLLDLALQNQDTIQDVLRKLKSRYSDEKDIRVLARDILTTHILVTNIEFADREVSFHMVGGHRGMINKDGITHLGKGNGLTGWEEYPQQRTPVARPSAGVARGGASGAPSWDAPRGGDLDDEIPF